MRFTVLAGRGRGHRRLLNNDGMPLLLVEMDSGDFARRRAPMVAAYARAIAPARGLTGAAARAEAERDTAERLPHGAATRHQLMRRAVRDGTEVGWIWVSLPDPARPETAWISDVEVDPDFRSRGYAAEIITAVEGELTALEVPALGLNVFGDNGTARRLYERLGFEVSAQQRSRELTGVPASDGVELAPLADYGTRIEALFADHARDLVHERGLWHGEAEQRAARNLVGLLPHGARTAGMILRSVVADGVPVGWVWAGLPAAPTPGMGWLHNIEIDKPYRGRGYGRAVIAAIESSLLGRGVHRMGLNVHGANVGARRLYDRLGYRMFAQQMIKNLPAL